jgi:hypothetical protein
MLCKKGVNHFGAAYKQVLSSPFDILPLPKTRDIGGSQEKIIREGVTESGVWN